MRRCRRGSRRRWGCGFRWRMRTRSRGCSSGWRSRWSNRALRDGGARGNCRRRSPSSGGGRCRGSRRRRWFRGRGSRRFHRWLRSRGRWRTFGVHRLPGDGLQHVARLGDSGEVDLGLDLAGQGTRSSLGGTGSVLRGIRLYVEVLTHFDCLIRLNGAGMRLFLNNADLRQEVEDFPALDFQFPCQIVDADLIHPSLRPPELPV